MKLKKYQVVVFIGVPLLLLLYIGSSLNAAWLMFFNGIIVGECVRYFVRKYKESKKDSSTLVHKSLIR